MSRKFRLIVLFFFIDSISFGFRTVSALKRLQRGITFEGYAMWNSAAQRFMDS